MFLSLTVLISLTVLFEYIKGHVIESVPAHTLYTPRSTSHTTVVQCEGTHLADMVDAMFGELTVLGFLGLVAFFISKGNALEETNSHTHHTHTSSVAWFDL